MSMTRLDMPVRVLLDLSFNGNLDQPVAAPSPITSVPVPNSELDLRFLFGNGYEKRQLGDCWPRCAAPRRASAA